jgi:uncharacterized protein (TIGR02145 family)
MLHGTTTTTSLTKRADVTPTTTPYYTYPGTGNDAARENALTADQLKSYGLLYNWAAASGRIDNPNTNEINDATQTKYRGVCPAGWHLPSDWEWRELTNEITGNPDKYSNTPLSEGTGSRMKSKEFVNNTDPQGSSFSRDKGGFDALLVGYVSENGTASDFGAAYYGSYARFWSSSSYSNTSSMGRSLSIDYTGVARGFFGRGLLFSVRCKKN